MRVMDGRILVVFFFGRELICLLLWGVGRGSVMVALNEWGGLMRLIWSVLDYFWSRLLVTPN